MQSARTLRSHIFIWTCAWRGITLQLHCLVCTCDLCLGQYLGHIILPTPTSRVESSRPCIFASLMTDILFAFPALFFRAPKCGQLASRSRSVSTHVHTDLCTIYRCTARHPLFPFPLSHWHFACFHCSMRLCCGRFRLYLFIIGRGIRRL